MQPPLTWTDAVAQLERSERAIRELDRQITAARKSGDETRAHALCIEQNLVWESRRREAANSLWLHAQRSSRQSSQQSSSRIAS